MRLWSIHPSYLDAKGLVALWREGLLAQKVLLGKTKGYTNHPQLMRFKNAPNTIDAICQYLHHVADEADKREYNFDRAKIAQKEACNQLPVTAGQIEYEFDHLLQKLLIRAPKRHETLKHLHPIQPHPLFFTVDGKIEEWEILP